MVYDNNTYKKEAIYLGTAEEVKDGLVRITQKNQFSVGDEIEIMKPDGRDLEATVEEIIDEAGTRQESAPHPKQVLWVKLTVAPDRGDLLRM